MKCAVSDFDRTFSMDGAVSRENREAVRRWQQAGHWFVIATGRNEASLRKKLAEDPELGEVRPDVLILNNGALILDREGNYLVRANSVWFLYDLKAGCPVRVTEEDVRAYGDLKAEPLPMDYAPRKLARLKEYRESQPLTVTRHYIDTNHHMNNARYAEIAAELLPENFSVGELRMEYTKAAVLGDVIVPRIGESGGGITVELCSPEGGRYAAAWFSEKKGIV